jgi:hypothetical protein
MLRAVRQCSAEGRTLQAVSGGGEHQLINWNFGPWESWTPDQARPSLSALLATHTRALLSRQAHRANATHTHSSR